MHKFLVLGGMVAALLISLPWLLVGIVIWAEPATEIQGSILPMLKKQLPLLGLLTVVSSAIMIVILHWGYRRYVLDLQAFAEQVRLLVSAHRNARISNQKVPAMHMIASTVQELAQQRDELQSDVDRVINKAKEESEAEKNRLAALMSELTVGVVVCNLDGQILLYNNRARSIFALLEVGVSEMTGGTNLVGSGLIGLGRSIYSLIERGPLAHALENVQQRLLQKNHNEFNTNFITLLPGGQLLRVQLAPILAVRSATESIAKITGYVLMIENITRVFETESARDQALQTFTDGARSALGVLRAAIETLADDSAMAEDMRGRFITIVRDEAARLSSQLNDVSNIMALEAKTRWPLEDVLGSDLVGAAQRKIEERLQLATKSEAVNNQLWIRADSFSLIQAMTFLAARLKENYDIRELRFRLTAEGRMAFVDLIFSGQPVSSETLYNWELEAMSLDGDSSPLSLRDVIDRHGGELWYQREKEVHRAFLRLVLPLATTITEDKQSAQKINEDLNSSRPVYYDFNLFEQRKIDGDLLDRPLTSLHYTVFDTETTGLEPSVGDEIIQIGAVRIVNNRALPQEVFDQLIDPQIPLKPEGIPIHGITEDMVRGKPTIHKVLPAFHVFCGDTILVAHNAAFDMRFLQIKEASTGICFSQPVLDTLLLSSVIHPAQESHRLEAIADRFGINIIGRHTALGDSLVTADVFLKMIPLLAERGITTLREAIDAAKKTYYAQVRY